MSAPQTVRALAICGPTASGKSEIAVRVALAVDGEIVNADSRQVYRDLPIGTAAPSADLQSTVPHHLYGFVDPGERYSAGAYRKDALRAIAEISLRGRLPIVIGGTGFYVEALAGTMPLDRPFADDLVRERVRREARAHPHEFLRAWLEVIDAAEARRSKPGDRYRTLRALEAVLSTRAEQPPGKEDFAADLSLRITVLDLERQRLNERIERRTRRMFENGLVDEALRASARSSRAPALTGIGYAEALAFHRGESTLEESIRVTVARTVRYAKRQRTWFKRMRGAVHVDAADEGAAVDALVALARETLAAE